jgi:hypothetical protein
MTAEPYFMRKVDYFFRDQISRGYANVVGEYIYSASYDAGEGFSSFDVAPCCDLTQEIFNLNVYTAGPANSLSIRVNAFGNTFNARNIRVKLFQNVVYDGPMNSFTYKKIAVDNLPLSNLQSPAYLPFYVNNNCAVTNDRIVVASLGLTYPATFNFNNQKNFYFELPATATGNYIVIDNFNYGTVAPILFDLTSGARYVGDILSTPGKVKFVLPASTDPLRKFILINEETTSIQTISAFTSKVFVDFSNTANQSDYIIISHPALYNDGSGNNYVDQYRQYRNSVAGGSFNTKVVNIDELTDQFAFGIKTHPVAIRDFVRYASQQFAVPPQYVFIIGRGMNYMENRTYENNPLTEKLNLVTTFGWPPSDVMLASEPGTCVPLVPIGRLSAVNGNEVHSYLQKVIQYEQVQHTPSPSIADKAWMKNMIHVVGGKDSSENENFRQNMNGYKAIAEDSLFGGYVETFTKTGTGVIQQANSQRIEQLFDNGLGFIGYFGHSSANTFEFNLSNPEVYTNTGKYPFFNVSGCNAGNFYIFDPLRFSGNLSLSEKYVLANQKGSIGFMADTHFGIPPFLNFYNNSFYSMFSRVMYGNSVGNQAKQVIQSLGGATQTVRLLYPGTPGGNNPSWRSGDPYQCFRKT